MALDLRTSNAPPSITSAADGTFWFETVDARERFALCQSFGYDVRLGGGPVQSLRAESLPPEACVEGRWLPDVWLGGSIVAFGRVSFQFGSLTWPATQGSAVLEILEADDSTVISSVVAGRENGTFELRLPADVVGTSCDFLVRATVGTVKLVRPLLSSTGACDRQKNFVFTYTQDFGPADVVPPFGHFDYPTQGQWLEGVVQAYGWVIDDVEVASITAFLDDEELSPVSKGLHRPDVAAALGAPVDTGYLIRFDTGSYPSGLHRLRVEVADAQDNRLVREVFVNW